MEFGDEFSIESFVQDLHVAIGDEEACHQYFLVILKHSEIHKNHEDNFIVLHI